uniref:C2H2-type domain-containing protein n=1 Tax=Panagrolaimus sp. JU765 TaxID=591449 RepID=A0AC34Q0E8_9BILA
MIFLHNKTFKSQKMDDNSLAGSSSLTSSTPITWIEVKMDDSQTTVDSMDLMKESDSKSKDDDKSESEITVIEPKLESSSTSHQTMVKDENGFTYYKCRFCGLTYNFLTTLKAHERVHDINQPYACNKCGESFHFMCELEYHAKSHLQQKGYKCDCGRTFYQYTDLLYHKHPEDEPDEFPLPMPQPSEPRIIRHSFSKPAIPESEFPIPDYAVKGFEPKHPLKVYSDIRSKPYICQYCSKSYPDSRQLAFHISSHRGEKNFSVYSSRYLMCRNDKSYISPGAVPSVPDLFLRRNYEDILHL